MIEHLNQVVCFAIFSPHIGARILFVEGEGARDELVKHGSNDLSGWFDEHTRPTAEGIHVWEGTIRVTLFSDDTEEVEWDGSFSNEDNKANFDRLFVHFSRGVGGSEVDR